MKIQDHTDYIVSHPAFADAVNDFNETPQKLNDLIFKIQLHAIDTQIKNSAREYGSCKRMNGSDIKEALLSMRQPDNLNIQLNIPITKADYCKVIDLMTHIKKKSAKYFNPLQLSLFPEYVLQANL